MRFFKNFIFKLYKIVLVLPNIKMNGYTQSNTVCCLWMGFPGGLVVKESACQTGDTGDMGSILGSGSSTGVGNGNPSSILAWGIPWTEEPGWLQSLGSQRVGHN